MSQQKPIKDMQNNLAKLRKMLGWTMDDLGRKIGITKQSIWNLENNKSNLTLTQYIAIKTVVLEEINNSDSNFDSNILEFIMGLLDEDIKVPTISSGESCTLYNNLEPFGVSYDVIQTSEENLIKMGYIQLPERVYGTVSALFQYAPGQIAENIAREAGNKALQKVGQDAYRVITKDGMHLAKSKMTPGAVRGSLLSDATNQVSGNAEWIKLSTPQQISRASQYALGFFNAMSIVTGQYFYSSINSQYKAIDRDLKSIAEYLEADKESKILADEKILTDIYTSIDFIKLNEAEKQATLSQLLDIKRDALSNMRLYEREILNKTELLKNHSGNELIQDAEEVYKYFPLYLCTYGIYSHASFLEVVLSDITDEGHINYFEDIIRLEGSRYNRLNKNTIAKMDKILSSDKSLNYNQTTKSKIADSISNIPATNWEAGLIKLLSFSYNKMAENKSSKLKKSFYEKIKDINFDADLVSEHAINNMEKFKILNNSPIDIINFKGQYYIGGDVAAATILSEGV